MHIQNWALMQAWDITMATTDMNEACVLMRNLTWEPYQFNPMAGYFYSFSCFETFLAPLVEFSHSDAFLALMHKGQIQWVYFVSTNMCIIDFTGGTADGEHLEKVLQTCISYDKEQTKKYKETYAQGNFIEIIVLSKAMMEVSSIRERLQDSKDRVFWDK